jgi:hypothetical protein
VIGILVDFTFFLFSDTVPYSCCYVSIKGNTKVSLGTNHPLTTNGVRSELLDTDDNAVQATEVTTILPTPSRIDASNNANNKNNIYAMGKRARERLDEERKKRKTIQVLQGDISTHEATMKLTTPPKRRRAPRRPSHHQPTENNMPISITNVVRVYISTTTPSRSSSSSSSRRASSISYVTPELLRKFFTGLDDDIERIFAIPYFPFLIEPLDDLANMQLQLKQSGRCWLRVFVQFNSNSVADLAVLRSGESITWTTSNAVGDQTLHHQQQKQQQLTFSIIVHPITENQFSTILPQRLSIDTISGEPILTTVQRMHACLPTLVSQYLVWFMAASILKLSHYDKQEKPLDVISYTNTEETNNDPSCHSISEMYTTLSLISDYIWSKPTATFNTINNRQQKYLISLYNALWDCHAELERTCSSLLLVGSSFGTSNYSTEHPAVRIVQSVSNWLLDEMEKKHIQLMQYQFHLP